MREDLVLLLVLGPPLYGLGALFVGTILGEEADLSDGQCWWAGAFWPITTLVLLVIGLVKLVRWSVRLAGQGWRDTWRSRRPLHVDPTDPALSEAEREVERFLASLPGDATGGER